MVIILVNENQNWLVQPHSERLLWFHLSSVPISFWIISADALRHLSCINAWDKLLPLLRARGLVGIQGSSGCYSRHNDKNTNIQMQNINTQKEIWTFTKICAKKITQDEKLMW